LSCLAEDQFTGILAIIKAAKLKIAVVQVNASHAGETIDTRAIQTIINILIGNNSASWADCVAPAGPFAQKVALGTRGDATTGIVAD